MNEFEQIDQGVVGNSRLTATVGAVLLIALFVEGITVFDVNQMFALHAFVGLFLLPVALVKIGSTAYRMTKYYRGDPAYRRKGPPHPILRVIGPLVVLSTILLLGTGVALLVVGRDNSDTLVTVHQGSFIAWVSVMTVHVIGHIVETWRLSIDDLRRDRASRVHGAGVRRSLVIASVAIGLGLGIASLGWNDAWTSRDRGHRESNASN